MVPLPQLSTLAPIADEAAAAEAADVEVWFAAVDPSAVKLAGCLRLLNDEELARQRRFYFQRDRAIYAVAHAMVRVALARHAGCAPQALAFGKNEYGRPYVTGPGKLGMPWFNLSHTHGLVACAISRHQRALGMDVEHVARKTEAIEIADRFFSPHEVTALHALPNARQRARFFAYWTLKESYIKACGMGLAIPLSHFSFELDAGAEIGISFDEARPDDASRWHFRRYAFGDEHVAALALASGPGILPVVRGRCWSPEEVTP